MKPSFHLERLGFGTQQRRVYKLADALDAYATSLDGAPTQIELEKAIRSFIDDQPDCEVRHNPPEMVVDAIAVLFSIGKNPFREFCGLSNIVDDAIFATQAQEMRTQPPSFNSEAFDAQWGTDLTQTIGALVSTVTDANVLDMADYIAAKSA